MLQPRALYAVHDPAGALTAAPCAPLWALDGRGTAACEGPAVFWSSCSVVVSWAEALASPGRACASAAAAANAAERDEQQPHGLSE